MPYQCSYCKQVKKCRKIYIDPSWYEWTCKDCDDYHKYLREEAMKEEEKRLKQFIKRRDKVLNKLNKSKKDKK